jgi:hypothetical protein
MFNTKRAVLITALSAASISAHAAIPVAVTDGLTAIEADVALYLPLVTGTVVAVALAFLAVRLVKKFINKAF